MTLLNDFPYSCKLEGYVPHDGDGALAIEMGFRKIFRL